MPNILEGLFYNPTKGQLDIEGVIKEIFGFISAKPDFSYEVVVGCDSSSKENPCFPLAIVVLRKGEGGRFFLKKISFPGEENKRFKSLKARILQEVLLSCELALSLREKLEKNLMGAGVPFKYEFKYIHADIGENGGTKDMIKEVVGLIRGNGFEAKIKPFSFAATAVADRYT